MDIIQEFWVTNFSNRNVSLSDLGLTIPAGKTVNLLDHKHYSFTLQHLQKSAESGSLFSKKHLVAVRKVAPFTVEPPPITTAKNRLVIPPRSVVEHKENTFDELKINDIEYAQNNSDLAEDDLIKYR